MNYVLGIAIALTVASCIDRWQKLLGVGTMSYVTSHHNCKYIFYILRNIVNL
jgi:hypothetical protein